MKIFFRYLGLELKRSMKVLGKSLGAAILTISVIAILAVCLTGLMRKLSVFETIDVGIVLREEDADADTMLALRFLASMDSVKSVSGFQYYETKEQALQDLKCGTLQAVVSLPPYFYEDVESGMNTPAEIYIVQDAGLGTRVFVELLKAGVRMLQIAEAGAYAALDEAYEDRPVGTSWSEAGTIVAYEYLGDGLLRDRVYDGVVLSALGEVGYAQYYFTAGILIVLLFGGLNFAHLYRKNNRALTQKLCAEGIRAGKLTLVRIGIMTVLLWGEALILYLLAYVILERWMGHMLLLDWFVPAGLLLLSFSMACYFHLVYAAAGGDGAGCVLLLAGNTGMILASGILIPADYLPAVVGKLSAWLPVYRWDILAMQTFFTELSAGEAGKIMAVSLCAAIAGMICTFRHSEWRKR